jgi:hypothetical protein
MKLSELKCTCERAFVSSTDVKMAHLLGIEIEEWHAVMDLWESTLDGELDIIHNMSDAEYFAYIERLKEAYGNLAEQASADQADS